VLRLMVDGALLDAIRPIHAISAIALGGLALASSTLHLGRPLYAFRAFIGIFTSWLSREIIAFGAFAKLAAAYAVVSWLLPDWRGVQAMLGVASVVAGVVGVFCSAMIYHDTRRVFWNISQTGVKFFATCLVVGIPLACATSLAAALVDGSLDVRTIMQQWGYGLCGTLVVVSALKLLFESTVFVHLKDRRHTPMKRTAILMSNALVGVTLRRFAFGILGGIVLPSALLLANAADPSGGFSPAFIVTSVALMFLMTLLGELHERYLFFTAVVSPKMPGGVM